MAFTKDIFRYLYFLFQAFSLVEYVGIVLSILWYCKYIIGLNVAMESGKSQSTMEIVGAYTSTSW